MWQAVQHEAHYTEAVSGAQVYRSAAHNASIDSIRNHTWHACSDVAHAMLHVFSREPFLCACASGVAML